MFTFTSRNHLLLILLIIFVCYATAGCIEKDNNLEKINDSRNEISTNRDSEHTKPIVKEIKIDTLEKKLLDAGLVNIQTLDNSILVDLKYSTTDNFMNRDVYGGLNNAYLQKEVAESLIECQVFLKNIDSSLTLLVYDAVRPRSVQQYMWDYLDLPINEKIKFVSNPKNGSVHNYGAAVDLTIAHSNGVALDMGAGYDDIRQIAYPKLESKFLGTGELTKTQLKNRQLLRKIMKHGHFSNIPTEWWHFNRYSRAESKTRFSIVE